MSCILGLVLGSKLWGLFDKNFDNANFVVVISTIGILLNIFWGWVGVMLFYAFGKIEEHCDEQCELLKVVAGRLSAVEQSIEKSREADKTCEYVRKQCELLETMAVKLSALVEVNEENRESMEEEVKEETEK